jgi:GH35 family endo-1,4-beta-xylanase
MNSLDNLYVKSNATRRIWTLMGLPFAVALTITGCVSPSVKTVYDEAFLDKRIQELRQDRFDVHVQDADGNPVTKPVSYELVRHEFPFGTAISAKWLLADPKTDGNARIYQSTLTKYFNYAVAENAHKWYAMEPNQGEVKEETALAVWEKCQELGLPMRGHCVLWGHAPYVQGWLKQLSPEELEAAIKKRMRHVLGLFKGKITEWDLNNEILHGDYYAKALGLTNSVPYFDWATNIAPENTYWLNDFPSLEPFGDEMCSGHSANLLRLGAAVSGFGEQGHFVGEVPPTKDMWARLDRMGTVDISYKITEFDIETTDEARQAADTRRFYKTCFAHPTVDAIFCWGFWANAHWRPKGAMWRRNWAIKPNGAAFVKLMEEWRTKGTATPNRKGHLRFRGFFGEYEVTCGEDSARAVLHREGERKVTITLQKPAAQ